MGNVYHCSAATQARCCYAILERFTDGFISRINLQDSHPCRIRAVFLWDDKLRIDVYSLRSLYRAHTILRPTVKFDPHADSDFIGNLSFGTERRYQVGVKLLPGQQLRLKVYFRPLHLLTIPAGAMRLEVVR